MLYKLYKFSTKVLARHAPTYLARRVHKGKEEPARLSERYGQTTYSRPEGTLVWIHAASVGEARSILALVNLLLQRNKDWSILVTTGTVTSARILTNELPPRAFHQFMPLDVLDWTQNFLNHWQPNIIIWVEQELWPNMLTEIHKRQIPVILANGRLTRSSFKRWNLIKPFASGLLNPFHSIYAQSAGDGERYAQLTSNNIIVNGNLKYASQPLGCSQQKLDSIRKIIGDRPVWLAASTHFGEEAILAEAHRLVLKEIRNALMILVPRHPDRGTLIGTGLSEHNLNYALRSNEGEVFPNTQVYLADTLGELGIFYRLCSIAFIGGSLVPVGGHNLIEPAQLGCVPIYGPYMENFEEIKEDFESAHASLPIQNAEELARTILDLMLNPDKIVSISKAARNLIALKGHVLDDLVADIESTLSDAFLQQHKII